MFMPMGMGVAVFLVVPMAIHAKRAPAMPSVNRHDETGRTRHKAIVRRERQGDGGKDECER